MGGCLCAVKLRPRQLCVVYRAEREGVLVCVCERESLYVRERVCECVCAVYLYGIEPDICRLFITQPVGIDVFSGLPVKLTYLWWIEIIQQYMRAGESDDEQIRSH